MDRLRDISDLIGTEDFSADVCQSYLDLPVTSNYDNSDVFVPNISCEMLGDIISQIKECDNEELKGRWKYLMRSILLLVEPLLKSIKPVTTQQCTTSFHF